MDKLKTFDDLEFKPHQLTTEVEGSKGLHAIINFPNGYGISVLRFKLPTVHGDKLVEGERYGSYTSNEEEWEVAIIRNDGSIVQVPPLPMPYDSGILGNLKSDEITKLMRLLQELEV